MTKEQGRMAVRASGKHTRRTAGRMVARTYVVSTACRLVSRAFWPHAYIGSSAAGGWSAPCIKQV